MTVRRLTGPDLDAEVVMDFINEAKSREHTVTLIAECEVEYEGRAAADLGAGDRVILLKPDGTVEVHKAKNVDPVNWQPPGSHYSAVTREGVAWIEAYRTNPAEEVIIALKTVYAATSKRLQDATELHLTGTEDDVVEKLVEEPDLIEDGFRILDRERETGEGPVDIYGKDTTGTPTYVEVKRGQISPANVQQLRRYLDAIQRDTPADSDADIRGILVGASISERAERAVTREGFTFSAVEPDRRRTNQTKTLDEF